MISLPRIAAILLILAFLIVAGFKAIRARQERQVGQTEALQRQSTRHFWDTYKQASQKRSAGDLEAAVSLYQTALLLKPDHEDSLYYQGNCYFELGRYREAIQANQRLIAVNPQGSSRGYMQLGLIYACLEREAPFDLEKASGFFRHALEVDPDSGAILGIGEVALLQGQWQKARKALHDADADNPMSMAAAYLLGYLSYRQAEQKEAWRWFGLAVQRGELKKPAVKWTEEGDVKADPELRWRALARQSVFGKYWLPLRSYLKAVEFSPADMEREYQHLNGELSAASSRVAASLRTHGPATAVRE
jgi:tetratricopeptide (TPR) repeat protein